MDMITILVLGLATAVNLGVIKFKLEQDRNADALVDFIVLLTLGFIFSGTITGLAIATVASAFISFNLYLSPPDKLIEKYSEEEEDGEIFENNGRSL